jgi:membrane fusion protein (multidrug efflux system)
MQKKIAKKIILYLVGAAAILGCITLIIHYFAIKGQQEIPPQSVEVAEVRRGSIVRRITVVGTLIANQSVELHSEVEGKISEINFEGGERVNKGDPIIQIDDRLFKARSKEAEAVLTQAKSEYERQLTLAQKNVGAAKNKERAYADYLQAQARFEQAQFQLDNTVIRAPFDGYVSLKNVSVGAFVDPRTELMSVIDLDPMNIDFSLPGTYLKYVSAGQNLTVTVDGFGSTPIQAKIASIDSKVDPTAHSIAVRAAIPNPRGKFKPGLIGRISIVVGSKDNALLVPEQAVSSKGEGEEFVYQVIEAPPQYNTDYVVIKTQVTTGLSEGGVTEIVRPLKEGDMVVTVGQSKIRHGYPVILPKSQEEEIDEEIDEEMNDGENGEAIPVEPVQEPEEDETGKEPEEGETSKEPEEGEINNTVEEPQEAPSEKEEETSDTLPFDEEAPVKIVPTPGDDTENDDTSEKIEINETFEEPIEVGPKQEQEPIEETPPAVENE